MEKGDNTHLPIKLHLQNEAFIYFHSIDVLYII
jgi:hypothetical protein